MLKRVVSLLLVIVVLGAGVFCENAKALTKPEEYAAAVDELKAYLNDERKVDLDAMYVSFSKLGAYEHSVSFMLYIRVLIGVESGDYSYVKSSINMMRKHAGFEEYLEEEKIFGSIDALENYAYGRKAENEGNMEEAIRYYENANGFADSIERQTELQFAIYEDAYVKACEAYFTDTYEGYRDAVELFRGLAEQGYKDSEDLMGAAVIMMEVLKPCEHEWQEANCLQAQTCALCGETDGQKGDHTWQEATCEIPKTCSVCKLTEGSPLGHSWQAATCENPETCSVCKLTEGSPLGHSWQAATCENPKTCSVCKLTEGSPLGHSWQAATCENPETCRRCGETRGTAKGHVWQEATCKTPKTCRVCSKTTGTVKTHDWQPATTSKPETCSVCGLTRGKKLLQTGDIVTFGAYEQDNNTRNGKEPIEWKVLEIQGNKALLISKYGLDAKPYHISLEYVTWETCTLREWLNGEFLNAAFTYEERSGILLTDVDNGSSSGYNSRSGGNNTKDKIFLLSYTEANKYFGARNNSTYNASAQVAPTAYAKAQGVYVDSNYRTSEGKQTSFWWLRSRGGKQNRAMGVCSVGDVDGGGTLVNDIKCVVRPALWVELNSSYIGF